MIRLLMPLLVAALLASAAHAETMAPGPPGPARAGVILSRAGVGGGDTVDLAQNELIDAITTLRAYARASLPPPSKAGRLVRVADESNVIYMDDGALWRPLGDFVGPRLVVPGATVPKRPTSDGVVGIGTRINSTGLNLDVTLHGKGSVRGMRLSPTLHPDSDGSTPVSGDAHGLVVNPTIHISQHSTGPVGRNAHKHVTAIDVEVPKVILAGAGKPQDLVGLRIVNSNRHTIDDVLRGLWALRIQGGLPSEVVGSIFLKSESGAVSNIRTDEAYHANALRISNRLAPRTDPAKNPGGEGFLIRSGGAFDTAPGGTHANIGNTEIRTPTVALAGGATVANFTTLKVGEAPAAIGKATLRALWVGAGTSEIEGDLRLGGDLELTKSKDPAPPAASKVRLYAKDNGAGKTQLCARFATGAIQCFASEQASQGERTPR